MKVLIALHYQQFNLNCSELFKGIGRSQIQCVCAYMYSHIYIYRERELFIHIYIYEILQTKVTYFVPSYRTSLSVVTKVKTKMILRLSLGPSWNLPSFVAGWSNADCS